MAIKREKEKSRRIPMKWWMIEALLLFSLASVGYSSWSIKATSVSSSTGLSVQAGAVEAVGLDLITIRNEGTEVLEFSTSTVASGGVDSDGAIGTTASITMRVDFKAEKFCDNFSSLTKVAFTFDLSYTEDASKLNFFSSSASPSLSLKYWAKSVDSVTVSPDSSSRTSSTFTCPKTISSISSYKPILWFVLTYSFPVSSDDLATLKGLIAAKDDSGNVVTTAKPLFNLKVTYTGSN